MHRDQRAASDDQRGAAGAWLAGEGLPQRDDREQAHDPDHDHRRLQHAAGDVAERGALVLAPNDRKQGDRRAHDRDRQQDLKERPQKDRSVAPGPAEDVVAAMKDVLIEDQAHDRRRRGDDEEHSGHQCALASRAHFRSSPS